MNASNWSDHSCFHSNFPKLAWWAIASQLNMNCRDAQQVAPDHNVPPCKRLLYLVLIVHPDGSGHWFLTSRDLTENWLVMKNINASSSQNCTVCKWKQAAPVPTASECIHDLFQISSIQSLVGPSELSILRAGAPLRTTQTLATRGLYLSISSESASPSYLILSCLEDRLVHLVKGKISWYWQCRDTSKPGWQGEAIFCFFRPWIK